LFEKENEEDTRICDLNILELIYQIKAGMLIQATELSNLSANMSTHISRGCVREKGIRLHSHSHTHRTNAQRY